MQLKKTNSERPKKKKKRVDMFNCKCEWRLKDLLFHQVQGPYLIAELRCYEENFFQVHLYPAPCPNFLRFGNKI